MEHGNIPKLQSFVSSSESLNVNLEPALRSQPLRDADRILV